jgi:vitamin B12 transporter
VRKGAPVDQDEPVDILAPIEVNVQGDQSEPKKLRESAEAVKVVDTLQAKQQSRDLGQVLGSVEGVAVRRSGGLGSYTRFSLNGLYDNQIRFFMDGVPLDIAGFPEGIANVPVNLVDRIEIYRGVLPVRFGADALGGAVNLVPQKLTDSNAYVSFQRGSYGTYRAAATLGYHHKPSGFVIGGAGWFDDTRNDYLIDVEVSDKTGKVFPAVIRRFHDRYRSYGGIVQAAFVGKPWAERLSLQLFGLSYDKEVQHDVIMKRPIGDATYGASTLGATARYEQSIGSNVHISALASIGRRTIRLVDEGEWVYDWLGNQVAKRNVKGELFREPHNATIWQDSIFARPSVEWRIEPEHVLRVSTTARFTGRTGTDTGTKTQGGNDPLAGARNIGTFMSGIEYELNAFEMPDATKAKKDKKYDPAANNRLQNIVVLKHYFYDAEAEGVPVGLTVQNLDASGFRFGVGDSLRFRFSKNVTAKASYELATRIPSVDEFFGDSLYVIPNLLVRPEYSHNANAGISFETRRTKLGNFSIEGDWFLRNISNLIVGLAESLGTIQYQNVEGAKIWGVEGAVKWISPGNWLVLDANATWQDARNVSTQGPFQEFDGQRIPNRPWLFANWSARFQWRKVLTSDDGISPFYNGRIVNEFFRNWESVGDKDFKLVIPTQMSHVVGISYFNNVPSRTSVTFEIDNLTSANLYDFFGVQKPGRVYSVKVTGEL